MPTYDVECSFCHYTTTELISLQSLDGWDKSAICPKCQSTDQNQVSDGRFKRVYKTAPAKLVGDKRSAATKASRQSVKDRFVTSGAKDDMRHQQEKRVDRQQVAAAREGAEKGEFL